METNIGPTTHVHRGLCCLLRSDNLILGGIRQYLVSILAYNSHSLAKSESCCYRPLSKRSTGYQVECMAPVVLRGFHTFYINYINNVSRPLFIRDYGIRLYWWRTQLQKAREASKTSINQAPDNQSTHEQAAGKLSTNASTKSEETPTILEGERWLLPKEGESCQPELLCSLGYTS